MNFTKITCTLLILFCLQSCLTYEAMSFRIKFDDVSRVNQIVMDYYDLSSTDSLLSKQESDFEDLLGFIQDDEYLLDNLDEGIYVKNRKLYEEDGMLHARIGGIFREIKFSEDQELKIQDNERILLITPDEENMQVDTDGRVIRTEENIMVVWPFDQKEIYWKIYTTAEDKHRNPGEKHYSLISQYRNWRKSN